MNSSFLSVLIVGAIALITLLLSADWQEQPRIAAGVRTARRILLVLAVLAILVVIASVALWGLPTI
jgi:hypothetical protein